MKTLFIISLLFTTSLFAEKQRVFCDSSKEFITTLEYLRSEAGEAAKDKELQNRKLAEYVSSYCSGAAYRFIKVVRLFQKMDLGINNAIPVAKEAVKVENERVELFVYVFKKLYLKRGFDLNPNQAIQVSKNFLKPTNVPAKVMKSEFSELSDYCQSNRGLARNKYQCAKLVWDLLASLEGQQTKIAESFIKNYEQLIYNREDSFSSYDAIKLSKKLLQHGPNAIENFRQAYKYATDDDGLNLNRMDAVKFAEKMASRSVMETELQFKPRKESKWWKFW